MLCGINIKKKSVVVPVYPSPSPVSSMGPSRRRLCRPSGGGTGIVASVVSGRVGVKIGVDL